MSIYDQKAPTGNFVKFQHNTVARMRFFGEAIGFMKEFKPPEGQKQQPARQRFATCVIYRNKETKTDELKIFEFGWDIQSKLTALVNDADWGDPAAYDIEITATGEKLERKYQLVPKPKVALSNGEDQLIASCDFDLEAICGGGDDESVPPPTDEHNPYA